MSVCVVSLDYLWRWHLRSTQCLILLHLIDICLLTCICLWQISQIQTLLGVIVGPGLVLTSPAFIRSSASHPKGPHRRISPKKRKIGPHLLGKEGLYNLHSGLPDSVTALLSVV